MTGVRLLVGTRKGAFILTADGKRQDWQVSGPHFGGWEIYHVNGSPTEPNRLWASQSSGWFGQQTSNTLWVYDAARDIWEDRAPLPLGRAAHAAAVIGDRLYVAGGIGPDSQRLQVYDAATDRWQVRTAMSQPREHLAAATLNGKLYAIGGRWGGVGNVDLLEEYDPTADNWRLLPPMQIGHDSTGNLQGVPVVQRVVIGHA